ncbi:MAG: hypothetical protein R2939_02915 [Kofleriaceae bacterium]
MALTQPTSQRFDAGPPPRDGTGRSELGPTEHPERDPDGVPHEVVGLLSFWIVIVAMLIGGLYLAAGIAVALVGGVILLVLATPALVRTLGRKADRERRDPPAAAG